MANNRMCLRCVPCDATFLLAKYYPTLTNGWFQPTNPSAKALSGTPEEQTEERLLSVIDRFSRLEEFLEKHSFCESSQGDWNYGNRRFDLTFEVPAPPRDEEES